jgi:hypothetical protein
LLQGSSPFFQLPVNGPGGGNVVIKGGRESGGQPFVVAEGGDVERSTAVIHGNTASIARTPSGTALFWSEHGSLYTIESSSLPVEELVRIAEGLQPINADELYRRIR